MEAEKGRTGVFFCHCTAGIISEETLTAISLAIHESGIAAAELNDLCALSIDKRSELRKLNENFKRKIIIACYPRAVENLLLQAGTPFQELTVLNFRKLDEIQIIDELKKLSCPEQEPCEAVTSDLKIPAWFPVVDKKRCTDCGQCAEFCLFGVYNYSGKILSVESPLSCKNNCPACARACPDSAIIFPRIKEDSAIAGSGEKLVRNAVQSGLLADQLRQRSNLKRNIFKGNLLKEAEEERRKALEELKRKNKESDGLD